MPGKPWAGVTVARILRSRGRKGEVAAEILTDFPQRLTARPELYLWDGAHDPRRVAVRSCWLHKGQAIFHFEGSDSIHDAEGLVGLEVQIPLADRMPLAAGRYFISDLIGCEVWEQAGAQGGASRLGSVTDVQLVGEEIPGTPLLVVKTAQGELLIPLAEEICRSIDTAARRVEVVLPDGLPELNRET